MEVDRKLQREILQLLKEVYPKTTYPPEEMGEYEHVQANLFYLTEHGLITGKRADEMRSGPKIIGASIKAKGLDFLEDDGGLSAILNTVTVRLEADQFRALIEAKVNASSLSAEKKKSIMEKLAGLGGEGLKHAAFKLIEKGVAHSDDLLSLL